MAVNYPNHLLSNFSFSGENYLRFTLVALLIIAEEDESFINYTSNNIIFIKLQKKITEYINNNSEAGIFIKNSVQNRLLPINNISWINESHRQFLWMHHYISSLNQNHQEKIINNLYPIIHKLPSVIPHYLQGINLNIAILDYWIVKSFRDLDTAIRHCREMELAWINLTESDKLFSWIEGVDEEKKIEFFIRFLEKKYPNNINYSNNQSYENLLIFFDNPCFSRDTKELYNQKVRKTWSQRVRRENEKDRKQCNFNLQLQTIDKLDKLSKKHGVSRNDIIQILIESEYRNDVHISARLSRKHQLMASLD